eukprot:316571-Pelagomonas_calceolata.AAC.2
MLFPLGGPEIHFPEIPDEVRKMNFQVNDFAGPGKLHVDPSSGVEIQVDRKIQIQKTPNG